MNIVTSTFGKKVVLSLTGTLALWISFTSMVLAQDRREFVDPAFYLEMVRVEILSIDEDGTGILRVNMHDCDGCTQDFPFNAESILQSPFGDYQGLVELPTWDDRDVLVVVGKQDGVVRRVTVN